jgi:hypothetical protein
MNGKTVPDPLPARHLGLMAATDLIRGRYIREFTDVQQAPYSSL